MFCYLESCGLFRSEGGAISFRLDSENVRFEINVEADRGQSLKMDAELSSPGSRVRTLS